MMHFCYAACVLVLVTCTCACFVLCGEVEFPTGLLSWVAACEVPS